MSLMLIKFTQTYFAYVRYSLPLGRRMYYFPGRPHGAWAVRIRCQEQQGLWSPHGSGGAGRWMWSRGLGPLATILCRWLGTCYSCDKLHAYLCGVQPMAMRKSIGMKSRGRALG